MVTTHVLHNSPAVPEITLHGGSRVATLLTFELGFVKVEARHPAWTCALRGFCLELAP